MIIMSKAPDSCPFNRPWQTDGQVLQQDGRNSDKDNVDNKRACSLAWCSCDGLTEAMLCALIPKVMLAY